MWLTNPSEPKSFRLTVGMVSIVLMVAAFHQLAIAILSGATFNGLLSAVLLFGALGLYMRVQWARILSITFLWGMILLALGCMSPFRVSDDIAGGITPPSIQELAIQYFIVSGFSIWCMHILGKYKDKFRAVWY